jgi:hypothetical protein
MQTKHPGRRFGWIVTPLLLLCVIVATLSAVIHKPTGLSVSGRPLAEAEMYATFGDATGSDPCKKNFDCIQPFTDGLGNCAYCAPPVQNFRDLCCNLGTGTQCIPGSGDAKPCGNNTAQWIGPQNGATGTCNSCAALMFRQNGTCDGLKNATGGNCP